MKIAILKQHFYRYIDRAEYAIAISLVVGTFATMVPQEYSSYLSDRNKRIERLNKNPFNHINVDYISFEKYQWMTDRNNWKSASLKPNDLSSKKNNYKDEVIETINSWLIKKTKKEANNNEVDPESLQKLAEMNGRAIATSSFRQKSSGQIINGETVGVDNNSIGENGNLPPNIKTKVEQQKYFIVQESGGARRYDPKQFRTSKKRQNLESMSANSKQKVGIIGGKNIEKDESIFQSIMHIFRAILYKDTKKYGQVINSNYDQYGNKIKKQKTTTKQQDVMVSEKEEDYGIGSGIGNDNQKQSEDNIIFLIPTFIIDGNLQQINSFNEIKKISASNSTSATNFQMLANLEYIFEKCWYQKYKNVYGNNFISAIFTVLYDRNGKVSDVTINEIDDKVDYEHRKKFVNDVTDMLFACDISKTQHLTKMNYNIWGKIKIQFRS